MSKAPAVPYQTTLLVRDHCLCLHTQRAARALARKFDDLLRPTGLTSGQFSLLMSLNRPTPPSIGAVADLLAMDRTTLTANLKPLQRRGLLDITTDPSDGRSRRITLTDAGAAALMLATPIWLDTHAEIEAGLAPLNATDLRASLNALR